DLGNAEIGRHGPQPRADTIGFVRLEAVQAQLVFLGIDRDGLLPQLVRGPHHADRDLTPVGDQNLVEGHGSGSPADGGKVGGTNGTQWQEIPAGYASPACFWAIRRLHPSSSSRLTPTEPRHQRASAPCRRWPMTTRPAPVSRARLAIS